MDYHVGLETFYLGTDRVVIGKVYRRAFPSGDRIAAVEQCLDQKPPDESARTGDDDAHRCV
jgi:hypothetical protein